MLMFEIPNNLYITFEESVLLLQWLSENEIIYRDSYEWFIWNVTTDQIQSLIPNPQEIPEEISTRYFMIMVWRISPLTGKCGQGFTVRGDIDLQL